MFDFVTVPNSMEFFTDPRSVMREVYRVLKPEGLCVIPFTSQGAYKASVDWLVLILGLGLVVVLVLVRLGLVWFGGLVSVLFGEFVWWLVGWLDWFRSAAAAAAAPPPPPLGSFFVPSCSRVLVCVL